MNYGQEMRIRIMARSIRTKLLARHSNKNFRAVLSAMTDAELVEREAQHHAETVAFTTAKMTAQQAV